jgi:hypothetical protein
MQDRFKQYYWGNKAFGELAHAAVQPVNQNKYPVHIRRRDGKGGAILCRDALDLITQADLVFDTHPNATLEVIVTAPKKSRQR